MNANNAHVVMPVISANRVQLKIGELTAATGHVIFLKWPLVKKYDSHEVRLTIGELAREGRMILLMQ